MCDYCNTKLYAMKGFRAALAVDAIGHFAVDAEADSPEGIEPYVNDAVQRFIEKTADTKSPFKPCEKFVHGLVSGIKAAWNDIPLEQKIEMAFAAGAVK